MEQNWTGLLVIDKPVGITSREAVDRASRWFPKNTRIGHTGTLDPLATGVLVLCLGSATRLVEYVQDLSKTYHSCFRLGAISDSDDADGQVTTLHSAGVPTLDQIQAALATLIGRIEQVPPAYSAARVGGRRAYALARQGRAVELAPRNVQVHAIEVLRFEHPELEVIIHCGKGTYIRSLARDLGQRLGCGGYVQNLRRLHVGPFTTELALPLDADAELARASLLPVGMALAGLPRLELGSRQIERLRQGQKLPLPDDVPTKGGHLGVFDPTGQIAAVVVIDEERQLLRPVKVL